MKIAITADLHLTDSDRNSERFETLENLLADLRGEGVNTLIIAGDLFDDSQQDYSDFETLCSMPEYEDLSILVIPGNHDSDIDNRQIVADNVDIISEPTIRDLDKRPFLFIPYKAQMTMGHVIASKSLELTRDRWILVGHGDWAGGLRELNPTETGVYMPLFRRDIETYRPAKVFLGHIHGAMDSPVYYAGSPCGLDITESDRRTYLIYDTDTNKVDRLVLNTPILYFRAEFVMVPVEDEAEHLRKMIEEVKDNWNLTPEEINKSQIRISIVGFSSDRAALQDILDEEFRGFTFYKGERPTVAKVAISYDIDRQTIAQGVEEKINSLEWSDELGLADVDAIRLAALHIIYGE